MASENEKAEDVREGSGSDDELELQEYLDEVQLQQVIAGIREGQIKTVTLGAGGARSG